MTEIAFPEASNVLPSLSRTGALAIPGRFKVAILWLIFACKIEALSLLAEGQFNEQKLGVAINTIFMLPWTSKNSQCFLEDNFNNII